MWKMVMVIALTLVMIFSFVSCGFKNEAESSITEFMQAGMEKDIQRIMSCWDVRAITWERACELTGDPRVFTGFQEVRVTKWGKTFSGGATIGNIQGLIVYSNGAERSFIGVLREVGEEWKIVERKRYECYFNQDECDKMLSEIGKFIDEMRSDLPQLQCISISEQVKLHEYLLQLKEIKAYESDLKARLTNEMEGIGIKKIENDLFSISYVAPTIRKGGIDEKKLTEAGINVDNFRKKESKIKSSVRITMK